MKKTTALLLVSVVGIFAGYSILQMNLNAGDVGFMLVKIGKSFFYGFSALALIFLVLVFVPKAFPAWKKFAIWFVPLAAFLFALYPYPGSGDFFSPYPEQIFRWVSALYVIISLGIIAHSARSNT